MASPSAKKPHHLGECPRVDGQKLQDVFVQHLREKEEFSFGEYSSLKDARSKAPRAQSLVDCSALLVGLLLLAPSSRILGKQIQDLITWCPRNACCLHFAFRVSWTCVLEIVFARLMLPAFRKQRFSLMLGAWVSYIFVFRYKNG